MQLIIAALLVAFSWADKLGFEFLRGRNATIDRHLQENRIVGGQKAPAKKWQFYVQGNGCGASLIWKDICLSAAHCKGAFNSWAIVGAYKFRSEAFGAERHGTVKQVIHPKNSKGTDAYDLMIVQLNSKSKKRPIKLNKAKKLPKQGGKLTVIGLGVTAEKSNKDPEYLRQVNVNAMSTSACVNSYRKGWVKSESMFCARANGKDSCFGDSGGPIFNGKGVQMGVVSWGIGCARKKYPGVYGKVAPGYPWIFGQVCKLSRDPPGACKKRKLRDRRRLAAEQPHRTNCLDSEDRFDLVNKFEDKDCHWLRSNMVLDDEELCDYLHIGYRCPNTCGTCHLLEDVADEE